jgi:hypothetical protein
VKPKAGQKPDARASVDVSTIRERFNFGWAMDSDNGAEQDTYWWWACSVRVDPAEVIADDGEGGLWSIPFSTDGADEVTFGTPVRVRETFVPVDASEGVAATEAVTRRRQTVLASELAKPEKPDRDNPAASRPRTEDAMSPGIDIAALRSRTGMSEEDLPDDATEEQINAALAAEPEAETPEDTPEETPGETPEAEVPEPAAASERTVTVDRAQWERTQRDAEAGAAARRSQLSAELDTEADDAVRDGRITPASRADWRSAIDPGENPDAAATARATAEKTALKGLTAGRVPVDGEKGTQPSASAGDDALLAATRKSLNIPTPQEG